MLSQGQAAQAVPLAAYTPHPVNSPLGVAKGLKPGRVEWVHDPQVTDWNGTAASASESWFNHINQTEATNMMQWALMRLRGHADDDRAAWNAIFQNFNGGAGYQTGEKIFIKVNLTTSNSDALRRRQLQLESAAALGLQRLTWTLDRELAAALVCAAQSIGECGGGRAGQHHHRGFDRACGRMSCTTSCSHLPEREVSWMRAARWARTKATKSTVPLYWSAPASETTGKSQDYLLQAVADAKYLINFSVLKCTSATASRWRRRIILAR